MKFTDLEKTEHHRLTAKDVICCDRNVGLSRENCNICRANSECAFYDEKMRPLPLLKEGLASGQVQSNRGTGY